MSDLRPPIAALGVLLAVALWPAAAAGPAWYEGFEGNQTSWQAAATDVQYRVSLHQRARGQAHTGEGSEQLVLEAGPGTFLHFAHDAGRAQVIDELLITVWVKASRPGVQLLAQVTLPRSIDPRTGRPVTAMVPGSSYTTAGSWQQLRLEGVPRLVGREARLLRAELGPNVDEREAYVERVLLNVYTGAGLTQYWIDDLDIGGFVARPASTDPGPAPGTPPSTPAAPSAAGAAPATRRVELSGPILLVDGRPLYPRALQYRGEPLELVARLGFNTVWLGEPPSGELAAEAQRLGLWIIAPPQRPEGLELAYGPVAPCAAPGVECQRVIAWDLGRGMLAEHLEATRRWAEQIRSKDPGRPLLGQPVAELRSYSRHLDLLLTGREPIGSSLELTSYANWIRGRAMAARPGTPFWTTVQTQLAPALAAQLAALAAGHPIERSVPYEQLRLQVSTAIAAGSRGLLFQSDTPLSARDPDTQLRATGLEQVNLELALIDPWTAAGGLAGPVTCTMREVSGVVMRIDRARLMLPTWLSPGAQYVPGQSAVNNLTLVVPGVPESAGTYELLPGGLRPARHSRVVGGTQIILDEFGLAGAVLVAQDPLVIDAVSRQVIQYGPRWAELQRHLAAAKWQQVARVQAALGARVPAPAQAKAWLQTASRNLADCDAQLAARQYQSAWLAAERAMRALRLLEREIWETAVRRAGVIVGSAGALSYRTLPLHLRLMDEAAGWQAGPNRLPGGDFEDLAATLQYGWQHVQHACPGVLTHAELAKTSAHSGQFGIQLAARPEDPKNPPGLVETPPVWIASPAVPVEAGRWVCIRGWVNVPRPIAAGVDGLAVIDSLGGEALAARIGQTLGWQEFRFYRFAPAASLVSVTFALAGLGQVSVDDVSIELMEPSTPGPGQPALPPTAGSPRWWSLVPGER